MIMAEGRSMIAENALSLLERCHLGLQREGHRRLDMADSLADDQWIQDLPYILAGIQQTMRQIEALK